MDITGRELKVLRCLPDIGSVPFDDIAAETLLPRSDVVELCDSLESKGLVNRVDEELVEFTPRISGSWSALSA